VVNLRVGVLGAGSWGTTFAALTSRNTPTALWARDPDVVAQINSARSNRRYLPGVALPARLNAVASIREVAGEADVIVMAVPSHGFREVLERARPHIRPWVPIVSLAKGLERGTNLRMTQVTGQLLPGHPVAVLTGPNLAREIIEGRAAASVLAMGDAAIVRRLQYVFSSGLYRVYSNTDVVGCELCGVLKNLIAIASGMADGIGLGDNTRAAMITRGLAEISRLGVAMGGRPETFAGLAGLGDLVTTCMSPLSRNRYVGEQLGKGRAIGEIVGEMHMIAEGVKSSPVVVSIARGLGVDIPMIEEVNRVLSGEGSARRALRALLRISAGAETEPG